MTLPVRNERAAEAFDRLPKVLRVGGYYWTIVEMTVADNLGRGARGECRPAKLEIAISRYTSCVNSLLDTLLHEICHAIYFTYGIHNDDDEELTVERLGHALMILHRDNPQLAPWITETLHTESTDDAERTELERCESIVAICEMLENEARDCIADIVPGDEIGKREANARAGALLTAVAEIKAKWE